jgi:LDH2 family malate/lactate/ureidoglycolate dehydrogenase
MNSEPTDAIRVSHEQLAGFAQSACNAIGLPDADGALLTQLLVASDLRGNYSHGTAQLANYQQWFATGKLNRTPDVRVIRETPCSVLVDGDGGLGYFPLHTGMRLAVDKALVHGTCVLVTRRHEHIGATGHYARIAVAAGLMCFVTTGHQLDLAPLADATPQQLWSAAGGSGMAFAAPGAEGPPFVLDFGTMHDLYANAPHREDVLALAPGMVLRAIGLGETCQIFGGFLAGVPLNPADNPRRHTSPRGMEQGAMAFLFRPELFLEEGELQRQVDAYVETVRELTPLPGFDRAHVAGDIEAANEARYRRDGIPVGKWQQGRLTALASALAMPLPWRNS